MVGKKSEFSERQKRKFADRARNGQKKQRRKFWQLEHTLAERDGCEETHTRLFAHVSTWAKLLRPGVDRAAQNRSDVAALYEDVDLGALGSVREVAHMEDEHTVDDLPPVEDVLKAGRTLNNLVVVGLGLHPRAPVIEQEYQPKSIDDLPIQIPEI